MHLQVRKLHLTQKLKFAFKIEVENIVGKVENLCCQDKIEIMLETVMHACHKINKNTLF